MQGTYSGTPRRLWIQVGPQFGEIVRGRIFGMDSFLEQRKQTSRDSKQCDQQCRVLQDRLAVIHSASQQIPWPMQPENSLRSSHETATGQSTRCSNLFKIHFNIILSYIVTGWTVRGSNADWADIFRTHPHRLWGPPRLLYEVYRVSLPGVKRPRRGVNHPPPSSAEVKERVEVYVYSGPSCLVPG